MTGGTTSTSPAACGNDGPSVEVVELAVVDGAEVVDDSLPHAAAMAAIKATAATTNGRGTGRPLTDGEINMKGRRA